VHIEPPVVESIASARADHVPPVSPPPMVATASAPVVAPVVAAPVPAPRISRPPADHVFVRPPVAVKRADATPEPVRTPLETRTPIAPPRTRPSEPVNRPRDAVAEVLAAAIRWTSSDEPSTSEPAPVRPRAMLTPPTPLARTHEPAIEESVAVAREVRADEPAQRRPQRNPTLEPRVARAPIAVPEAAPSAPEQITGVHIGTVDIQIVQPSEPAKPATAPAAPAPRAALARGFTTTFGLRQS
jgi:hypothetical protein